ncbi:hypothetical protein ABPG74_000502 [Tetrahymena malaccensis]
MELYISQLSDDNYNEVQMEPKNYKNEESIKKIVLRCISLFFFGILFYYFQKEENRYNNCRNTNLTLWALITSITYFSGSFFYLCKLLLFECIPQKYSDYFECCNALLAISYIVTLTGMIASISLDCGQLTIFLIIYLSIQGFFILTYAFYLCLQI